MDENCKYHYFRKPLYGIFPVAESHLTNIQLRLHLRPRRISWLPRHCLQVPKRTVSFMGDLLDPQMESPWNRRSIPRSHMKNPMKPSIQGEIFRSLKWVLTFVPYVWPYFVGIFPYIAVKQRPYIWKASPIEVPEMAIDKLCGRCIEPSKVKKTVAN